MGPLDGIRVLELLGIGPAPFGCIQVRPSSTSETCRSPHPWRGSARWRPVYRCGADTHVVLRDWTTADLVPEGTR